MSENNVTCVPFALEADSPKKLSALMLQNNLAQNKSYAYHITVKGNKFQAWYYEKADAILIMSMELEKIKKGK